ncbi:hypothetical protein PTTG_25819 [Puccinia triticina 1-1 BBBD Race 1]|uniref:Uncharacterized protein n=2 Tax=Puccinia triticina TaxID=208348 RepID=A0A180GZ93_PUCT1|nr:uncharacterized protein PtA15_10A366 [Puccinia triticina]OAV98145.1 hypothetical protein PTTG_25819 [Puccinia triticina 1-1 BBBD Race 1]WAQ88943.1 hypothetical protein PtA15_10A366 [Puccinia triticina]WAR58995.1 hypothetical protein PtB15_10B337 [Puccinia triticina]
MNETTHGARGSVQRMLKLRARRPPPRRPGPSRRPRSDPHRQKKLTYLHPLAKARSWEQLLDVNTKRATQVDHPRIWTMRWHYPSAPETRLGTPPAPYPEAQGRLQTQEERTLLWSESNPSPYDEDADFVFDDHDESLEGPAHGSSDFAVSDRVDAIQVLPGGQSSNSDREEENAEAARIQLIINEFLRDFVPN